MVTFVGFCWIRCKFCKVNRLEVVHCACEKGISQHYGLAATLYIITSITLSTIVALQAFSEHQIQPCFEFHAIAELQSTQSHVSSARTAVHAQSRSLITSCSL